MAWRNPRWAFLHAARDTGAGNISAANTFSTTQPEASLVDDRGGDLCTFTTAASDHHIQVDRGSGSLEAVDRLWIPSGHNMSGDDLRLRSSTDSSFTTATTLIDNTVAYAEGSSGGNSLTSGALDFTFSSNSDRYLRVDWPSQSINPEIGELVLTRTRTTTAGPGPGWSAQIVHGTQVFEKRSGVEATLSVASDRKSYEFDYRGVTDSSDLDVFADLFSSAGTSRPFLLDPPFDTNSAVWVRMVDDARQTEERLNPGSGSSARPRIRLRLLEWLA